MIEYRIKISYRTGNSLRSEDTEEYLEYTWNNLNIAKENLQRIKGHYQMYLDINDYNKKLKQEDIFKNNQDKEWFVFSPKNEIDSYYSSYLLKLKLDNGKDVQTSAFWIGHFEELYTAEIEVNDDDIKIDFL